MRNLSLFTTCLAGVLAHVGLSSPAKAQVPESLKVDMVSYEGTGCPQGSVESGSFPDKSGFYLTFLQFDIDQNRLHRFCNSRVRVRFPPGWTFSLASASYHGFANLTPGVNGIFATNYWFPATRSVGGETRLNGPFFGRFEQVDTLGVQAWAPCGGGEALLTLKTQIGLSAGSSDSYMNTQDQDLMINYTCHWRRCPG